MRPLEDIKADAAEATPGPWRWNYNGQHELHCALHGPSHSRDTTVFRYYDPSAAHLPIRRKDVRFITRARQDVPDLIAEVERLRELGAALFAFHEGHCDVSPRCPVCTDPRQMETFGGGRIGGQDGP